MTPFIGLLIVVGYVLGMIGLAHVLFPKSSWDEPSQEGPCERS